MAETDSIKFDYIMVGVKTGVEAQTALTEYGKAGWRLHTIIPVVGSMNRIYTLVFETNSHQA